MFYNIALWIVRFVMIFVFRICYIGRENMPLEGGCILAANHRSNWDPVIAGLACPRHLTFMAKEELFKNPIFGKIISGLGAFPIRRGGGDVGAVKGAFKILNDGRVLLMFPEGHRMKNGKKGKAKPGAAMIAQRAKVPVVPMYISGQYKWMHKITVTIGNPISLEEYYGKRLDGVQLQELADGILDNVWSYKAD